MYLMCNQKDSAPRAEQVLGLYGRIEGRDYLVASPSEDPTSDEVLIVLEQPLTAIVVLQLEVIPGVTVVIDAPATSEERAYAQPERATLDK